MSINAPAGDDTTDLDALLKGLVDDSTSGLVSGDALLAELMNSTDIDALLSGLPGGDTGADEAQQA